MQVENIQLNLKKNDPNALHNEDLADGLAMGGGQTIGNEPKPDKRQVEDLWTQLDLIDTSIKTLKETTSTKLREDKDELLKQLDLHFTAYRQELQNDNMKKKQNDEDPQ